MDITMMDTKIKIAHLSIIAHDDLYRRENLLV